MALKNFKELLSDVKAFVLDVDGVLTDGTLYVQQDGTSLRRMHIRDGYALQLAVKKGFPVFIISGSNPVGVDIRLKALGIDQVYFQVEHKLSLLENLLIKHKIHPDHVIYMGDDMPDLEAMKHCGVRVCPADASHYIKAVAQYISEAKGGMGCVRDVIEQVLTVQHKWE